MTNARGSLSFKVFFASGTLLSSLLCGGARARAAVTDDGSSSVQPSPSVAPSANAIETQPLHPGIGMVRVHVSAGAREFLVFLGRGQRPIAACRGECDFWAWPEKYRAVIRDGDAPNYDATVALRVQRPGDYVFVPAHGGPQNAGLVLGVAGPAIGVAGLVFTAAGLLKTCSAPPSGSCDTPPSVYIGLAGFVVGTGMTTAGWWLYAHNRAHFQLSRTPSPAAGPHLAVLPLPRGGLGLGLALTF